MASESEVPAKEAAAPKSFAWFVTSRVLYLSYGMIASEGMPALSDAVLAAPSFTVLSPQLGLDYFAVFDGRRRLGGRLLERLADAIAGQVHGELLSANPRFAGMSHDVAGWWRTVLQEAYHAVDALVASSDGEGASPTTALVALVLEKYVVIANRGASKAVLCRGGEHVELTHHEHTRATKADEKNELQNASGQAGSATPPVEEEAVDVVTVAWEARDEFLILGSGEFWSGVTPASACALVRRRLGITSSRRIGMPPPPPPHAWGSLAFALEVAKELARMAVRAGSHHNVNVAVILLKNLRPPTSVTK